MKRSISLRRFTALLLGLLILTGAIFSFGAPEKVSAATVTTDFAVTLDGSQTWIRPDVMYEQNPGNNVWGMFTELSGDEYSCYYAVATYTCVITGHYKIEVTSAAFSDTMLYVYSGAFNSADKTANFLIGNDDITDSNRLSAIPADRLIMTAGQTYSILITGYFAGGQGDCSYSITGPSYMLTYAAGTGGSLTGITTQEVSDGGSGSAVTAAADPDYVFTGWSDGITANSRTDAAAASDLSVTAEFAQLFDVTFDSQGGSPVTGITNITDGSLITAPAAPVMDGYTFGGWYKEAACTNAWDFAADTVTADTTLFAKWTINSYAVTFDSQGGSSVSPVAADYNTLITAPAAPTREGYTFGGWYKEAACTNAWDFAADKVTGNTTLFAKWTINTYTVTFKDWDGKVLGTQTVPYGSGAAAPANPTRSGYSFTGWSVPYTNVLGDVVSTAQYTANIVKTGESGSPMMLAAGLMLLGASGASAAFLILRRRKAEK